MLEPFPNYKCECCHLIYKEAFQNFTKHILDFIKVSTCFSKWPTKGVQRVRMSAEKGQSLCVTKAVKNFEMGKDIC